MTAAGAEAAARAIVAAYDHGSLIARLSPDQRPDTIAAAYRIQDHVATQLGPVGGWKVGRNPSDGADTCAPLFGSRIFTGARPRSPRELLGTGLEIEFAFRIGTDLPARNQPYSVDEVRAAIDAFVPLVELVGGRFENRASLSPPEQLADGYGAAVFTGEPMVAWHDIDFTKICAELWIDGMRRQSARGVHPAGDPLILVAWLANHLAARPARGLRRGQIVTTGGLAGVTTVVGGETVEARYLDENERVLTTFRILLGAA